MKIREAGNPWFVRPGDSYRPKSTSNSTFADIIAAIHFQHDEFAVLPCPLENRYHPENHGQDQEAA